MVKANVLKFFVISFFMFVLFLSNIFFSESVYLSEEVVVTPINDSTVVVVNKTVVLSVNEVVVDKTVYETNIKKVDEVIGYKSRWGVKCYLD